MLDYDFIFRRGTLFIWLRGNATKKANNLFIKEINPLILDNGIKNVVFNVSKLSNIDKNGIDALYNSYLTLNKESSVTISGIPSFLRDKFKILLNHINEREDEYTLLMRN